MDIGVEFLFFLTLTVCHILTLHCFVWSAEWPRVIW